MPVKEFIEQYPLYKKFHVDVATFSQTTDHLPRVRVNMVCENCKSSQTFSMRNNYVDHTALSVHVVVAGAILRMTYRCTHCEKFEREFLIKVDLYSGSIMKVGQYPAWDINGDPNIEKLLGTHAGYYRRGLICESQGYGIGAFGYYRRIVEEIIDALLDDVSHLLAGAELTKYQDALQKTKQTRVTQEKIDLVKDLLPPILRPDGVNPLAALHSSLSEGLHADSDETCLDYAAECREVLVFLTTQIAASRASSKGFTENMRKLLDRKARMIT